MTKAEVKVERMCGLCTDNRYRHTHTYARAREHHLASVFQRSLYPVTFWGCPAESMGEFCRWLMEINGPLWADGERAASESHRCGNEQCRVGSICTLRVHSLPFVVIIYYHHHCALYRCKKGARTRAGLTKFDSSLALSNVPLAKDKLCPSAGTR